MADLVLVSVVSETLLKKLISIASKEISGVWGIKDELTKLHQTLVSVKAALNDAEKKQAVLEEEFLKNWLTRLQDIAYDAEDVFDEFEYEALRRKLEIQGSMQKRVLNSLSVPNPLAFRLKMARKIKEINQSLNLIAKDAEIFKPLRDNITDKDMGYQSMYIKDRPETSSHLLDSEVVGREVDKSRIIDLLVNGSNNEDAYSVVRIVGIGGIGKTTLAQLIYNDKSVKDHFDVRMWAYVSQNSNKKEIFNKLLESIKGKKNEVSNLDYMVINFNESLVGTKYLIVLDDVWNHGKINWEELLTDLLSMGAQGSKLILTARSDEDIPSIMAMGAIYTHRLEGLPEEACQSLFEKVAFGHGGAKKTPKLIEIGKEIVKKCGGVPLAVKTLRSLMYSKRQEDQWLSILKEEIWNLPEGREKIISVLKLSYYHLPTHLKQCFSYCSIFPKGHNINRKKLIQLWMAEGFLGPPKEIRLLENIDNEYFDILLQNSLFQVEERNMLGDVTSYKMHDLVHDLAYSIVGTECSMLDATRIQEEVEITRLHRVRLVSENKLPTIPEAMHKARKLRTFVTSNLIYRKEVVQKVSPDMFLKLSCLRVLDLSHTEIQELPPSIGELKHLRYLDLSHTKLKTLPDSCTNLYHLQTLRLKRCYSFREFPKYMKNLVNLKYLQYDTFHVFPMIREVGKLSQLQKLSEFVVGKDKGFGIEELNGLSLLGGKLAIHQLENVRDALGANLKEKQNICCLELHWHFYNDDVDYCAMLEGLQPNQKLKKLTINNFHALKFPKWMTSASTYCIPNLVSITLTHSYYCEHLPALGQLPFLRFLDIRRMKAVKRIGSEFYYNHDGATAVVAPRITFPSLEQLYLHSMDNLEEWQEDRLSSSSSFPCLEKLDINYCPLLKTLPTLFPSLKTLISRQNGIPLMSMVASNLSSLRFIHINDCPQTVLLPQELLQGNNVLASLKIVSCHKFQAFNANQKKVQPHGVLSNKSLYEICIRHCPALKSLPDLWGFSSLRMLTITSCGSLMSLPDGIQCLPTLEELSIGPFSEKLKFFPLPAIISDGTQQYFVSLRVLRINGWSVLKSLPNQLQYVTSLQELQIHSFPSLVSLPEWLGNLALLQTLEIDSCDNLMHLPSREQMLRLTELQTLKIGACPLLVQDYCFVDSDEASKTSHIPNCVAGYIRVQIMSGGDKEEKIKRRPIRRNCVRK